MHGQSVRSIVTQVATRKRLLLVDISQRRNVDLSPVMRTILVLLCLAASFDVNFARTPLHAVSSRERSDSTIPSLRHVEEAPVRLPRKFRGNSRTRRLHIENQHGFDGKVEKIHINSEEDHPGVMVYGLQKKHQLDNGHIERMMKKEMMDDIDDTSRLARSIEAYGKNKKHLDTNGHIETMDQSISQIGHRTPTNPQIRIGRSIEMDTKGVEDLEAQDSKVFRPLFVYRQQVAKRQHRARNQIYGYHQGGPRPCHDPRLVF